MTDIVTILKSIADELKEKTGRDFNYEYANDLHFIRHLEKLQASTIAVCIVAHPTGFKVMMIHRADNSDPTSIGLTKDVELSHPDSIDHIIQYVEEFLCTRPESIPKPQLPESLTSLRSVLSVKPLPSSKPPTSGPATS